jgi:hypothetical protein
MVVGGSAKILYRLAYMIVGIIIIISALIMFTVYRHNVSNRTITDGVITAINNGEATIRYSVEEIEYNTYTYRYNTDAKAGDKIKVAYSNDSADDVKVIGDTFNKIIFVMIFGVLWMLAYIVLLMIRSILDNRIYNSTDMDIEGVVSELVRVVGTSENLWYAVAYAINDKTGRVIEAKSNQFNRDNVSISVNDVVMIRVNKNSGNTFVVGGNEIEDNETSI